MKTRQAVIDALQSGPLTLAEICERAAQPNTDRRQVGNAVMDLVLENRISVNPEARSYKLVPPANTKNPAGPKWWVKWVDSILIISLIGFLCWADYGNMIAAEPPFYIQGK